MDPTNQNPPLSKEELMERELSNLESEGGIAYDKPETSNTGEFHKIMVKLIYNVQKLYHYPKKCGT